MSALRSFLATAADGAALDESAAEAAFDAIMSGQAEPVESAAFLMALKVRGETPAELVGAARALRSRVLKVEAPADAIDTVGTGGDHSGTFNISTAAALVTAACGVPVAKHGNRAATSKSGAADVLQELGVNLDVTPETVSRALKEANIGFLFAQKHHSAFKNVAELRKQLGVRTIFNLIGPLCNPAGATRQLVGVFDRKWMKPMAEAFARLGSRHVWVVHGSDGLDEITTTGVTYAVEMKDGVFREFEITPEDAGLKRAPSEDLKGGDAAVNAAALRTILHGRGGAYRDIAVLNSAAALVIAGKATDLKAGAEMARNALTNGHAAKTLAALVAITNGQQS
ncbi:MAG: anthranilate phosphoribosyltransferase [Rhodospirillaceae bacterium]|nr:anthranilate phosphoribosyltransferase [Rhodospirillaceae bacterium]